MLICCIPIMEFDILAKEAVEMAGVTTNLLDSVIIREDETATALDRTDEAVKEDILCSSVLENYRAILRGVEENQSLLWEGYFFNALTKESPL